MPPTEEELRMERAQQEKPALDQMLNLNDFEAVAKHVMSADGWAYYSSAADDEITVRENRNAYHRIWLKPRVLVDVRHVSTSTKILGYPTSLPGMMEESVRGCSHNASIHHRYGLGEARSPGGRSSSDTGCSYGANHSDGSDVGFLFPGRDNRGSTTIASAILSALRQ